MTFNTVSEGTSRSIIFECASDKYTNYTYTGNPQYMGRHQPANMGEIMQVSDYDIRQFSRMIQVIDEFLVNKVSLREVVSTLSFLLTNLEDVSGNWRGDIQENWGLLEMINADTREQDRKLTEVEREFTLDKARKLKDLVQKVLEQ